MATHNYPLMTLFGRTTKFLTMEFENRLEKLGIDVSMGDFVILYRLATMPEDKITQQNFATMEGKHKSVILRQIDALEAKKLVARLPDNEDKRVNLVTLTKKGRSTLEKIMTIENEMMNELTAGIPAENIEILKQTIFTMQQRLLDIR